MQVLVSDTVRPYHDSTAHQPHDSTTQQDDSHSTRQRRNRTTGQQTHSDVTCAYVREDQPRRTTNATTVPRTPRAGTHHQHGTTGTDAALRPVPYRRRRNTTALCHHTTTVPVAHCIALTTMAVPYHCASVRARLPARSRLEPPLQQRRGPWQNPCRAGACTRHAHNLYDCLVRVRPTPAGAIARSSLAPGSRAQVLTRLTRSAPCSTIQ